MARQLVLFVRLPRLGTGKRRLARDIGALGALAFERRMIVLMVRRLGRDRRWRLRLAITPDRSCREARRFGRYAICGQGAGDLGDRMRRALVTSPPGPVVLVGADIPALAAAHVAAAFRMLGSHDLVVGPSRDGGFWLVGARRCPRLPPLFGPVRWSTRHALADVLANLPPAVRVGFAATLEDVDDGAAWQRLRPHRGF
ncbi:MAG: DUF2064 domain-containing protein [Alphaproteobacteria bacterium]|nr:DUF2064 domain-containing protein [Alphaproteobacteria bacterium]